MAKKRKVGRPNKYDPKFERQAYSLSILGMTDVQLAQYFEISKATLNNWKKDHPKFLDSLKKGKEIADTEVAKSLYKRACGYDYKEEQIIFEYDGKTIKERKIIKKHVAPDVTAQIFWLKNRQPQAWRDKINLDHTTKGDKFERKITLNIDGEKLDFKE